MKLNKNILKVTGNTSMIYIQSIMSRRDQKEQASFKEVQLTIFLGYTTSIISIVRFVGILKLFRMRQDSVLGIFRFYGFYLFH